MNNKLTPGLSLSKTYIVSEQDLASTLKTSLVSYASTASLIILTEKVICNLVEDLIGNKHTTVGAEINVKHLTPIGLGAELTCSVYLKFVDNDNLFFDFAIFNKEEDIVAIGAHERIVVKIDTY